MMMGPDKNGTFRAIVVKGMQENRVDIESASKGQTVTILVKSMAKGQPIKPSRALKKGMTLIGLNMTHAQSLQKKGAAPLTQAQVLDSLLVRDFEAEVIILHHASTIKQNYQAVMHSGSIRQCAIAVEIENISAKKTVSDLTLEQSASQAQFQDSMKRMLNTGEKGLVRFRFAYYPEILRAGATIMFREGRTKGIGYVTRVFHGVKA